MDVIISFIIVALILVIVDHVRFNRQINAFCERLQDFSNMYQSILTLFDDEDKDIRMVEYRGIFYSVEVEKGDYRNFLLETKAIAEDVLQHYKQIDSRYFEEMDDETAQDLEMAYKYLMNAYNQIRVEIWQNGFLN